MIQCTIVGLIDWRIDWRIVWSIEWLNARFILQNADWLIEWVSDLLTDWLIDFRLRHLLEQRFRQTVDRDADRWEKLTLTFQFWRSIQISDKNRIKATTSLWFPGNYHENRRFMITVLWLPNIMFQGITYRMDCCASTNLLIVNTTTWILWLVFVMFCIFFYLI